MSFFKAATWARATASDQDELEKDLFSHSDRFMDVQKDRMEQERRQAELAKEKEQRRQQRKQERTERREGKRIMKRDSPSDDEEDVGIKKRRITSEESAKLLALTGVEVMPITIDDDEENGAISKRNVHATPVRRSPRHNRVSKERLSLQRAKGTLNSLGCDSDSDDVNIVPTLDNRREPIQPVLPPTEPEEELDSDPEIAALQRKARERHKRKLQQREGQITSEANPNTTLSTRTGLPTPPLVDPIISLLIDSDIPNTGPLLVKRKLSQNLQPVREAWCKKHGFSKEMSDKIFLTHLGRRQYDASTCRRLGVEVDSQGNVMRSDRRDKDGAAQVLLIATTEELFEKEKAEKAHQARIDSGEYAQEEDVAQPELEEETTEKQVTLVIKAKDKKDATVHGVTPTTKIVKLLKYAKKKFGIPDEQAAYLQFDGEELSLQDVIANTELENEDTIDLVLRREH